MRHFLNTTTLVAVLVLAGCTRGVLPEGTGALVGSSTPLLPNPSVRLAVAGAVGGRAAEVEFDVTSSLTLITSGCVGDPPLQSAQVRLVDPLHANDVTFPVTRLEGLRVGSVTLRPLEVGLMQGKRCVVVLGLDVLGGLALQVKVSTRQVAFVPSRSKQEWLALRKASSLTHVIEVTRDPTHDWPLLTVRAHQEPESMTATFVLSTRDRFSLVFDAAARAQGVLPAIEVLRGHGMSANEPLPSELESFTGFPYERLELAPDFGVRDGTLDVIAGDAPHGVAGALAIDVWGKFDATYDVKAGVLALKQPALITTGNRHVCTRGDDTSEMACFELHAEKMADGLNTVSTVWRPLEHGARLYFDVVSPVSSPCRIGVSFSEGDQGRSAQHVFPWKRMAQTMPACAAALAQATDVKLGLFDEGPLAECPGVCGFAQDLRTGRVGCECQPKSGGTGSEGERRFFELYRKLLGPMLPSPDLEPSDPD